MSNSIDVILLAGLGAGVLAVAFLVAVWRQRASTGRRGSTATARADARALPAAVVAEAIELVVSGRKIEAIRGVREATGWDLRRSKEAVEALQPGRAAGLTVDQASDSGSVADPADLDMEMRRLLAAGRKIEAVKLVRERTGRRLKEAKEYVERRA